MNKNILAIIVSGFLLLTSGLVSAACQVSISTSLYINWVAIDASQDAGLYDQIEKDHGCKLIINFQPDYLNSLSMFTTSVVDAVTVTNLDQMLAISSRPSTAVKLQDYSSDNDGLLSRNGKTMKDIVGQKVYMVRASISEQYFIMKARKEGLNPFKDFELIHVDSDGLLLSGYLAGKYDNIVTWNPALDTASSSAGTIIGTSAEFPYLIIDMIALASDTPEFNKKANFLRDLWNKTASVINSGRGNKYSSLLMALTDKTGNSIGEVKTMLKGSKIFTPEEEIAFYKGQFPKYQAETYKLADESGFFSEFNSTAAYELNGNKGGDLSAPVTVKYKIQ